MIPPLSTDRGLIPLLTQLGLTIVITLLLSSAYSCSLGITIGIVAPTLITSLIFRWKKYKRIVFCDEKYPEKVSGGNILAIILFPLCYSTVLISYFILSESFGIHLNQAVWFLVASLVYFICVFYLFISKIYTHEP